MEHIGKAIERAKDPLASKTQVREPMGPSGQQPQFQPNVGSPALTPSSGKEIALDAAYLENRRIVAYDVADPRSRPFDMLRTQVLQFMDMKSWQLLGITSPTEGCGKSVVAINLALSIARQPDKAVLLVDIDLQKPQVAGYLGLNCDRGILSVLEGKTNLQNSLIRASIRKEKISVLPCERSTLNSSEWVASRQMSALLQEIKRDFKAWTVIIDLPPILTSDDVISILPQLDCVLFVVGAGTTTTAEIKECNKHLESTSIVRVVLNKAEDATATYYSYSRYAPKPASPAKRPIVAPSK